MSDQNEAPTVKPIVENAQQAQAAEAALQQAQMQALAQQKREIQERMQIHEFNLACSLTNVQTIKASYETVSMMFKDIVGDGIAIENLPDVSDELAKLNKIRKILLDSLFTLLDKPDVEAQQAPAEISDVHVSVEKDVAPKTEGCENTPTEKAAELIQAAETFGATFGQPVSDSEATV